MYVCMHVHMCACMCGDQRSTSSVVPRELFTFVFEIWSLNGLEYTKQASLTDQHSYRQQLLIAVSGAG